MHVQVEVPDSLIAQAVAEGLARASGATSSAPLTRAQTPRFQKYGPSGALPESAETWPAVIDNASGLIWPVAAISESATHAEGLQLAAECRAFGKADWRMPLDVEWATVIDRTQHKPALHPDFARLMGESIRPDGHWTSSPDVSAPDCAWYVDLSYGGVDFNGRVLRLRVRVVRSAVPSQ